MVVEKKDTGQVYAMKVLSKQHLKDRGEIEHTISERRILEMHTSPFLVSLKFSFQTPEKVRRIHLTFSSLQPLRALFSLPPFDLFTLRALLSFSHGALSSPFD